MLNVETVGNGPWFFICFKPKRRKFLFIWSIHITWTQEYNLYTHLYMAVLATKNITKEQIKSYTNISRSSPHSKLRSQFCCAISAPLQSFHSILNHSSNFSHSSFHWCSFLLEYQIIASTPYLVDWVKVFLVYQQRNYSCNAPSSNSSPLARNKCFYGSSTCTLHYARLH